MKQFGLAWFATCSLLPFAFISPAHAQTALQVVIARANAPATNDVGSVDLLILNGSGAEAKMPLPERVEARVGGASPSSLWLNRAADAPAELTVPAGGFAQARYRFAAPLAPAQAGAVISIPAWQTQQVALGASPAQAPVALAEATPPAQAGDPTLVRNVPLDHSVQSAIEADHNLFFRNFSFYEPMYIVFGSAKDSEWRVQLSFKYRLFGTRDEEEDSHASWRDGIYMGFSQRMFWDIAGDSSFRDINYLPELFYRTPSFQLSDGIKAGVQLGIQHESNGKAGDDGRSANNVYIAPTVRFDLGGGYDITLSPRYIHLIGGRAGNPDLLDYRGHTSLNAQIGQNDGLRLATYTRYNFSTGHGSFQGELSYPLTRIWNKLPQFYLFGQGFTGYGESLLDYNRKMNRLRFGLAFSR